jgi:hypothetical protein
MMTLHGADVYLRAPETPTLPDKLGPFALIFISDRGTRVYPPPAPDIEPSDWPRARYFSEEEVTPAQLDALASQITDLGFEWTMLQKLFRIDGNNAFSQPY